MFVKSIYFITDRTYCSLSIFDMVSAVLGAGIRFIQYREKGRNRREIYEEASRLRELTHRYDALLFVNDYADIALAVDADGVHLGQDDLPLKEARKIMGKKIIGVSTHDPEQAKIAEGEGADYIGFGPVFPTTTKDAGSPKGVDALRSVKGIVRIPVVAIGGINGDNMEAVLAAGADAAAVATAICRGNIAENAARLFEISNKYARGAK